MKTHQPKVIARSGRFRRLAGDGWALALHVERRFDADGAFNMASSLAYTSLLSLVPLLAIALAMLAAFPVFDQTRDQLQATLFRYVVPELGAQVESYVAGFVRNAGKLTAAGIAGLAVSAVLLLVTIESSFNQIFRVSTPRTPLSRLLLYWTALTLGPLLLGTSFSLTALLPSVSHGLFQAGVWRVFTPLAAILPTIILMAVFAALYVTVPNRRVPWPDAAVGGIAAGFAFTLLRWGFAIYVGKAQSYQSIYGAVATIPIFLFWMYLSWMVVLFGAELTAALPEWRLSRVARGQSAAGGRRLRLALSLLSRLLEMAGRSGEGLSRLDLLDSLPGDERDLQAVLGLLSDAGFVVETAAGRYVLGRDPAGLSLFDLVRLLGLGIGPGISGELRGLDDPELADRLDRAAASEAEALDLPLRELLVKLAGSHAGVGLSS